MNSSLIDTENQLNDFCSRISEADWFTVDTEFMRERTYYPKLCLIQVGIPGHSWCIDALADISLSSVIGLVCNGDSTRVLHAARQDLEIFYHLNNSFQDKIFDSQIAAGLLGMDAQIGYAGLVKELMNVELEKGYQRANWALRPIPEAQLEYALDDVRYLSQAYPMMLDKLAALGRLEWALEDSARLLQRNLYITEPSLAYFRIGKVRTLPTEQQHVVAALAKWRESLAQKLDQPRNWIASDSTLVYLAQTKPDSMPRLNKVKGIKPELLEGYGEDLLKALEVDEAATGENLMNQQNALTDAEQKLYRKFKELLDERASSLQISTPVLGTRKDVELIIRGEPGSLLTEGWRKEVIGNELLSMV